LMAIFLTDNVPEQYALRADDAWLEIRGVRGELRMTRVSADAAVPTARPTQEDGR
jgi:hypothetical protein